MSPSAPAKLSSTNPARTTRPSNMLTTVSARPPGDSASGSDPSESRTDSPGSLTPSAIAVSVKLASTLPSSKVTLSGSE